MPVSSTSIHGVNTLALPKLYFSNISVSDQLTPEYSTHN